MQLSLWIAFFVVSNLLGIEVFKAAVTLPWDEALLPGLLTCPPSARPVSSLPGKTARSSFYNPVVQTAVKVVAPRVQPRPSVWSNSFHVHP